jgi:ribulose bisphosphate carboxylase small subunit
MGNWMWGNFFYNVSYAVSDITACKMSSNNNYVTVLGISNSMPVVMLLNKVDGSINTFITI